MERKQLGDSELILNPDGSIYHLKLLPEDIADTIILVGDPGRVDMVAEFFDTIEVKKQNREFRTVTGTYKGKRLTVLSTGIGTDNIDIVINELDALVNIDLKSRQIKDTHTTLNFIRIGTSGALQEDLPVDTPVAAKVSLGFDSLMNFYADRDKAALLDAEENFMKFVNWSPKLHRPYFIPGSDELFNKVAFDMRYGITISAPGFYGPQGRYLRLKPWDLEINDKLSAFEYNGLKITNFEMESSAVYGLSKLLGHNALTVCNIIANRMRREFSKDYKKGVRRTVEIVLDRLAKT